MTITSQLKTGLNGWKNLIFKNSAVEQLAEGRRQICDICEHRVRVTCGLCGCPLAAKQRAVEAGCPDGRWFTSAE